MVGVSTLSVSASMTDTSSVSKCSGEGGKVRCGLLDDLSTFAADTFPFHNPCRNMLMDSRVAAHNSYHTKHVAGEMGICSL